MILKMSFEYLLFPITGQNLGIARVDIAQADRHYCVLPDSLHGQRRIPQLLGALWAESPQLPGPCRACLTPRGAHITQLWGCP